MESVSVQQHRESSKKKKRMKRVEEISVLSDSDLTEEERLRKQMRRAKKLAKRLEKLGLDENGEELDNFALTKYPVREWSFSLLGMNDKVAFNPLVTLIGVVCLWTVVLWCSMDPVSALEKLAGWRSAVSLTATWILQGSKAVYLFFIGYILWKYGGIRFGDKNDKPEFSTLTYASMIIAAGAGNTILVYAMVEPLSHRVYNFYVQAGYRSEDEVDMFAICMTLANWGLGGWAPNALAAIAMCLAVYRFKLPMTYRSCLYPILGQYTWGWIGDVVDGFAIVVTLSAVFSSLGLASMNIVAGFVYMGWIDGEKSVENLAAIENTVIWVITVLSLASVATGLHGGVKYLCILAIMMSGFLALFVFVLDDTKFLLNLQVQTVGYYLQSSILQLNFWTDAFGQLREGSGRATDGHAAEPDWMESWLNYSMGWWISGAAVNGQFICSISRGRKLWEVVVYSLIVPVVYCLVWFCIWGGTGMRHLRQASEMKLLGESLYNASDYFLADGSELCYDVPQHDLVVDNVTVFTNHLLGVSPVCEYDEDNGNAAIFHVLNSFSTGSGRGLGPTLSFLFMFTCAIFYMTGAGSAAFVVDKLAGSGRNNTHLVRRMFWIVTVGALATALLTTGGGDALSVLQAAMILCGLPCAILLCYFMQAVVLMCVATTAAGRVAEYPFPNQPEFATPIYGGIFNVVEYAASLGQVNKLRIQLGMDQATSFQCIECLKGLLVPFVSLNQVLQATYPQRAKANAAITVVYALCYMGWFGMFAASFSHTGAKGYMWVLFTIKGLLLAVVRCDFRAHFNLRSNAVGDVVSSLFFWPQVMVQMREHCVAAAATKAPVHIHKEEDEEA